MSMNQCILVCRISQAEGSARLVLLTIAVHINPASNTAWPSLATIARETKLSTRQVIRIVKKLEASGELLVLRRVGCVNVYRVNLSTDSSNPGTGLLPGGRRGHPTRDTMPAHNRKGKEDIAPSAEVIQQWLRPGSRIWKLLTEGEDAPLAG